MTFDSPDSNISCTHRSLSNTPIQALTLWNDPVFYECARALARRVVNEAPVGPETVAAIRERARYAVQLRLARQPSPEELEELVALYQAQLALSRQDEKVAAAIVGPQPQPSSVDAAELAAWVIVGRTLMNLDEFITIE